MYYINLEYADNNILSHPVSGQKWGALSDEQKGNLILWAERMIDKQWFLGVSIEPSGQHQFPRDVYQYVRYTEIWRDASDEAKKMFEEWDKDVPERVRQCACEIIICWLETEDFYDFVRMQKVGMQNFSSGSINTTFKREWMEEIPEQAWNMIAYLTPEGWYSDYPPIGRA